MAERILFISLLAVGLTAATEICKDEALSVIEPVDLLQHRLNRLPLGVKGSASKHRGGNSADNGIDGQKAIPPVIGTQENLITFGLEKTPDFRLMTFRNWTNNALLKLPERQLEAKMPPARWDHPCTNKGKMIETLSASPKIPRHLHYVLFLERESWVNETDPSRLIDKGSPAYAKLSGYEQLLIENMRYTTAVHDMKSVHFMSHEACRHVTGKWSTSLREIYENEGDLRFKSDICRVAALYWEGGYYFDEDMVTYQPVSLRDDTEFATALGFSGISMFQSFLASTPCNPILARNMELMIGVRQGSAPGHLMEKLQRENFLLGPVTLKEAYDESDQKHSQLLLEVRHSSDLPAEPDRGGVHTCEFVVTDESSKKLHYCSRL